MDDIINIIKGCIGNDHKYQKLAYERYRGFALKTVFRYIYTYEKATDVMHDGFVKIFRHFSTFNWKDMEDLEKMLMGWMRKILINTAIDELRKMKMMPEIGGIPENVWEVPDDGQQADQLLLYKDLITCVKKLPPQYRVVFNMYVIDGYSHYEIADRMQFPVGTSKSTLSRARMLLQKYIKQEEGEVVCSN